MAMQVHSSERCQRIKFILCTMQLIYVAGRDNRRTVKGVNFFGAYDEYIVSGSDCGNLFVWSKRDGCLRRMAEGDNHVLNCVEPHPHLPLTIATSGALLAHTICFSCTASVPASRNFVCVSRQWLDINSARAHQRKTCIPLPTLLAQVCSK
jgi:hypothetical protein